MSTTLEQGGAWTRALHGEPGWVVGLPQGPVPLPADRWRHEADTADRVLLAHCTGPTVDLGCGPGRMAAHLTRQGREVLAVDRHPAAVALARARGVAALHRDLFDPLPGEGRWSCALLADGNIGIGGDPVRLLRRLHRLLAPGGAVVLDLAAPGTGLQVRTVHLRVGGHRSRPFRWCLLGVDALPAVAAAAQLSIAGTYRYDGRWFAVLRRRPGDASCPA